MKKLINNPDNFIRESLEGMALAYPELIKVHFDPHFIYRAETAKPNKVALISGGGSGHEPLHGGYVGLGMLDAACPGEIFTSPTPDQMLEAAKIVNNGAGILNIVKNYSGDVMNFELAAELAISEGIKVADFSRLLWKTLVVKVSAPSLILNNERLMTMDNVIQN
jgi:phosphoenolpyruvate---glycerone phosphotransferase subunit DhaK